MSIGYSIFLVSAIFAVVSVNGLNLKGKKKCCDLGTHFSSDGQQCRSFKAELAGDLANDKQCLNMVDVCCKKRYRELQCDKGLEDAKNGLSCPIDDGDRKDCCESCLAGIDTGKLNENCQEGMGLGPPYDDAFTRCCEDVKSTSTAFTTTTTAKIQPTDKTPTRRVEQPIEPDLNFNTLNENICDSDVCAQLCEPVGDTYKCDCFKGYILMEDGVSCKPEKRKKGGRCEISNPCDHDCTDTGTAIKCSCREGYELAEDNRTCQDVDECTSNLHDCVTVSDCINEIGSYSCYDPLLPDDNDTNDFENKCPIGFRYNFQKLVCDDIDECQFDLMCIAPKTCKNTIGSFVCEGEDTPNCPPGFHFKAATESCSDIDECLSGEDNCNKESQVCLNTIGNFTCVDKASKNTCPPGFKKNHLTQDCEDIDECEEENVCSENEKCINEPGGHTCVPLKTSTIEHPTTTRTTTQAATTTRATTTARKITCPKGYSYQEQANVCTDINECQMGIHECQVAERCDNTIGSYHCSRIFGCGTGYTLNSFNGLCEDDDECSLGSDNCRKLGGNFKCRNTLGSYRCEPVRSKKMTIVQPPRDSISSSTTASRSFPGSYYPSGEQYLTVNTTTARATYPTFNYPTLHPKTNPAQNPLPNRVAGTVIPESSSSNPGSFNNSRISGTIIPLGRTPSPTTMKATTFTTTTVPPTTIPKQPTLLFRPYPTPAGTLPYYSPRTTKARPIVTRPQTTTIPTTLPTTTTPTTTTRTTTKRAVPTTYYSYYPVISGQQKKCLPGYTINYKGDCEDINECENNPCNKFEKCVNFNGRYACMSPMQCKMGLELNESGDQCIDVNECSRSTHRCLSTQICKNYHGYYTCECPPGHHLDKRTNQCEDFDECRMYRPCRSGSSICINTKGSFRCDCKDGFQRKSAHECSDIDECMQTPGLCDHNCVNIWGSYRCSCKQGFTLNNDNSTCTDANECERFKDRKLCIGTCKNVPGSYACECPPGYKLGSDGRVCIDIDECQQNNVCLRDEVCLNTRGSYKCYRINCPPNYIKDNEHKSRCKRLCDPRDNQCTQQPEQYTYQYITLVSNLPLSNGILNLFKIKGPEWYFSRAVFTMKVLDVNCPHGIERAGEHFFRKSNDQFNSMTLYLIRPIQGPQEIKLQIEMRLYQGNNIIGNAVVYIIIVVSEYPF